ncbi:purine nucleoside phosphorylase [Eurytemora carolleeae]|uniref:purine nucleoside phosphorylase n=1 Tax=Eurytemora carolleeae TaxID=1294199 RepID=UPI000C7728A4|nr:purine nucleoside phosphorylase [Eurytemora carolleeae]|eukprot:XP_023345734.1 purine nucleoside phosphorylase-like [Eurytemora affinis]
MACKISNFPASDICDSEWLNFIPFSGFKYTIRKMADSTNVGATLTNGIKDPISRAALQPTADYILQRCEMKPLVGIICGSGLGELGDLVTNATNLNYNDIPGSLLGRVHCYEGFPLWHIALPVRVMKLLGIRNIIITNAVGALNPLYQVGDLMLVKDHINMFGLGGQSPLQGPNDEYFGPRFFDVNQLYSDRWRHLAREAAKEVEFCRSIHDGVLTIAGGPNYESVAELKMLSMLGADCVGMSSIPESLVAHHCGIQVLAFSLVTNLCTFEYSSNQPPNHEEVLEVANQCKDDLKKFVSALVKKISLNLDKTTINGNHK